MKNCSASEAHCCLRPEPGGWPLFHCLPVLSLSNPAEPVSRRSQIAPFEVSNSRGASLPSCCRLSIAAPQLPPPSAAPAAGFRFTACPSSLYIGWLVDSHLGGWPSLHCLSVLSVYRLAGGPPGGVSLLARALI